MARQRYPLDRSAAFTALLELDAEGFGKQDMDASGKTITKFLDDWCASDSTNMYKYAQGWLKERQEAAQRAPEAPGADLPEPAAPGEVLTGDEQQLPAVPESLVDRASGGDWQVTAQVHREADGWQTSRQVPTFTIPRWAAPTKGDAQAKAREIMNPYQERYEISMDVWAQDGPQIEVPEETRYCGECGQGVGSGARTQAMVDRIDSGGWVPGSGMSELEQEFCAAKAREASDGEAWGPRGPRGPSASYEEWLAEGQADPGPDERQLEDWAEHNAIVGGLEAGQLRPAAGRSGPA